MLSLLPPFTPVLMSARIATGDAVAWHVALALAVMVLSIGGLKSVLMDVCVRLEPDCKTSIQRFEIRSSPPPFPELTGPRPILLPSLGRPTPFGRLIRVISDRVPGAVGGPTGYDARAHSRTYQERPRVLAR